MSINFRLKNQKSAFCTNDNLINPYFSIKVTNVSKCTNNNIKTDVKLDEWTILDLINSCSCEKTKEKLANLYANHIQKSVAINESMKIYLGLSANEATILGAIYIPTAKSGRGYLSNKMIGYATGLSRRTIQYALRKFEKKGLIETICERDEQDKMKVNRNITFTQKFYASAKATGCYTIQTPEVEDSGEIHEMSTKPIISQVQNLHINNNNTSSTSKSNHKLLLESKQESRNNLDTSIKNETSNLNTHVKTKNLNTQKVNANAFNDEYSNKKQEHEMIAKKRFTLDSYDKIIEDFVDKNYKESKQAIISGLKSMLTVWYCKKKTIGDTKLKLTNDQLKDKLKTLFRVTNGDHALALIVLEHSRSNHFPDFYTPSKKLLLAWKDRVVNAVIKTCQHHLNEKCPVNNPNEPIYKQVTNQIQDLLEQACSMETTWSRLKHGRPLNTSNNTHLLNKNANIFVDSCNTLNDEEIEEPCDYADSLEYTGINTNQTNQSRLLINAPNSIDARLVKGNQHDCAFTLDEDCEDTNTLAESALKNQNSNQMKKGYIYTLPPNSGVPPSHCVEDANLVDGQNAIKSSVTDQIEIKGQNNRFKGDLVDRHQISAMTNKNASNELKSAQNDHNFENYLKDMLLKPDLVEKFASFYNYYQKMAVRYFPQIKLENVEKTLRKFNTAKYCGNTELALSLLDQADRELKICIKEAKKLISEEKRKQARAIAESNKKYEEELKAIAHNTLEEAKRKLMGVQNQPDLNQKSQEIERSNEDLTDEDEEWARKMQEIIDKKRSQKQSDHEPLNEEQQFAHNMIGEIKAKLMGAFKKEKKERECDNV